MNESPKRSTYKIILLGDPGVGKTSIRRRYFGEGFRQDYLMTLGTDFAVKYMDNLSSLQIWDLSGAKSYRQIRKQFFMGANGAILVLDITREESISNLSSWFEEIQEMTDEELTIIIVGNKIDLRKSIDESLSIEEIGSKLDQYKEQIGENPSYYETSALTGENIDNVFDKLVEKIEINFANGNQKNNS